MSEERTAKGPTTVHPLTRAQQTAGRRAAEARATVPDVAWTVEAPAPAGEGALLVAVARALREAPRLNATYRDGDVVAHGRVNLGVAVAGDDWTLVPVLADADEADAAGVQARLDELRATATELTAAAFAGATFTVAGLGLGVRAVTPVVAAGQVAALGVGAPEDRVVAGPDGPVVASRVELTLAADARAVQGTAGPRFLHRLAELLA